MGAVAAIALAKLPNTQVAVYEKSVAPQEIGESISVTDSGMQILNELIDISAIENILYRGAVVQRHWQQGDVLGSKATPQYRNPKLCGGRTLRTDLHAALLSFVPEGTIIYDHNVSKIDIFDDKVHVSFLNKPEKESADLVVAADGIYSKIRRQFYPDSRAAYRGVIAYRSMVPFDLVKDVTDLSDHNCIYPGKTGVCFLTKVGNRGLYNVGVQLQEPLETAQRLSWRRKIEPRDLERIRNRLNGWNYTVREVFSRVNVEYFKAYPLESTSWLKELVKGDRLVFVGDAAHPTSGAYGSGANFGFNDVWVLYQALLRSSYQPRGASSSTTRWEYDHSWALNVYNRTRSAALGRIERQLNIDGAKRSFIWAASDDIDFRQRYNIANSTRLSWLLEYDAEAALDMELAVS